MRASRVNALPMPMIGIGPPLDALFSRPGVGFLRRRAVRCVLAACVMEKTMRVP